MVLLIAVALPDLFQGAVAWFALDFFRVLTLAVANLFVPLVTSGFVVHLFDANDFRGLSKGRQFSQTIGQFAEPLPID
jgi:hypothetical protein